MFGSLSFYSEKEKMSPYGSNTQEVQNKISELQNTSRLRTYSSGLTATFNRSKAEGVATVSKMSAALLSASLFTYGAFTVLNDILLRPGSKPFILSALAPAGMCLVATHEMYKNTLAQGYHSKISEIVEMHTEAKNLTMDQKGKVAKMISAQLAQKGVNKIDLEKKIDKKIKFMLLSDEEKAVHGIRKFMKITSTVSKLLNR